MLLAAWRDGRLAGRARPEAFFVHCDDTTTSVADVAAGVLRIRVGWAPVVPAEFELLELDLPVRAPTA